MRFVSHVSKVFAAVHAVRCFDLAAKGRDQEALQLVVRTRTRIANDPRPPWDLELQLLQAYLHLEVGQPELSQQAIRGAFRRIKARSYNFDEKAVFVRYAISVLWIARGRQRSRLLLIRRQQTFDVSKVRGDILRHFSNPDEVERPHLNATSPSPRA